jgi:benzoyl-CoA reductase subunit B
MLEHRLDEFLDQVEWLEKLSGRKFDDEVFVGLVKSALVVKALAAEVYCLNQSIPAPLDIKSLYSFYTLGGLTMADQDAVEAFWKELRDEVKWRVDNHIAAVGTERYRYVEDEPPPWYFLKYYRYLEKYGAVGLGSRYQFSIAWPFDLQKDGSYVRRKTVLELGWPLNTRREAMRANMLSFSANLEPGKGLREVDVSTWGKSMVQFAKAYKADGAVLPLWDAGVGCVYGRREYGIDLTKAGVKIMYYEGSQCGDRTDFDENRMLDQIDNWMESQGLHKLED